MEKESIDKEKEAVAENEKRIKNKRVGYIKFFLELAFMIIIGFLALYPLILFLTNYLA